MTDYTPTTDEARTFYELGVLDRTTRDPTGEFDRWLDRERFKSRQDGYALRMHDEREGIGAHRDEWLETPVRVERPQEDADG